MFDLRVRSFVINSRREARTRRCDNIDSDAQCATSGIR